MSDTSECIGCRNESCPAYGSDGMVTGCDERRNPAWQTGKPFIPAPAMTPDTPEYGMEQVRDDLLWITGAGEYGAAVSDRLTAYITRLHDEVERAREMHAEAFRIGIKNQTRAEHELRVLADRSEKAEAALEAERKVSAWLAETLAEYSGCPAQSESSACPKPQECDIADSVDADCWLAAAHNAIGGGE